MCRAAGDRGMNAMKMAVEMVMLTVSKGSVRRRSLVAACGLRSEGRRQAAG